MDQLSCINMAQYCAQWLNAVYPQLIYVHQGSVWLNAVHQASIWLNAVHQAINKAQCCASGVKYIAQCHASSINVGAHHASIWLKCWCIHIRHQYGLILCVSGIKMAQNGSMLCIMHQIMWLNAVHSCLNDVHIIRHQLMLCIRHHNYWLMLCRN